MDEYTGERYHSAVKAKYDISKSVIDDTVYRIGKLTTFQHDVCSGVRDEFIGMKAIYSELPYPDGYSKFNESTQAKGSSYDNYIDGLNYIIRILNVPAFLLVGKIAAKKLKPDKVKPIMFRYHKIESLCCAFNYDGDLEFSDEIQMRDFICRKFESVLDPSCGYGILAKAAYRYDREVMLTDVNSACIYYILGRYGSLYENSVQKDS